VPPRATVAFQVEVTAGSFRRTSVAQLKCRRRDGSSDEICLRLRRTGQIDLRSDVREPRKSDHAVGTLADVMVDALSGEASRKTGGPNETKLACVSFTFLPEAAVSPEGDHTPPAEQAALCVGTARAPAGRHERACPSAEYVAELLSQSTTRGRAWARFGGATGPRSNWASHSSVASQAMRGLGVWHWRVTL